nr:MAG TPA: hypothetical protein [Caudoviricetes sp.]
MPLYRGKILFHYHIFIFLYIYIRSGQTLGFSVTISQKLSHFR